MPINNCRNYNCGETPDHDNDIDECGSQTRQAGAQRVFLIECNDTTVDDTSGGAGLGAQLVTAIAAGTVKEIDNIKFGFETPSPVLAPAKTRSCGAIPTVTYNRTGVWEDYNVTLGNALFYDEVKNRTYGGIIVMSCSTEGLEDIAFWIDSEVTISEFLNNGNDNDVPMFYTATPSWSSKADPLMIAAPTGV